MVPELYVGLISAELFLANFLSYSGVNKWYKCLKSNENMENLNSSSVKASDMVPGVYVGPIFAELFLAIFLSNSAVNLWYKCLKSNQNMQNLISSSVKASDMVREECAIPISESYSWEFVICNSGEN